MMKQPLLEMFAYETIGFTPHNFDTDGCPMIGITRLVTEKDQPYVYFCDNCGTEDPPLRNPDSRITACCGSAVTGNWHDGWGKRTKVIGQENIDLWRKERQKMNHPHMQHEETQSKEHYGALDKPINVKVIADLNPRLRYMADSDSYCIVCTLPNGQDVLSLRIACGFSKKASPEEAVRKLMSVLVDLINDVDREASAVIERENRQ